MRFVAKIVMLVFNDTEEKAVEKAIAAILLIIIKCCAKISNRVSKLEVNTMSMSGDAREYLEKLYSCMPKLFYSELEATQRGFGFVLSYLEQADEKVYAGDLSKKLNVSTARIAALLKRMEQNGLITRRTSSKDARRTVVEITSAGIASVDEMRKQALYRMELLLARSAKKIWKRLSEFPGK